MQHDDAVQAPLRARVEQVTEALQLPVAEFAGGEERRRGYCGRQADERYRTAHPQVGEPMGVVMFTRITLHVGKPAPGCPGKIGSHVVIMVSRYDRYIARLAGAG